MLKLLIGCLLLLCIPTISITAENLEAGNNLPGWIIERALKSKKLTVERYEYGGKIYYLTSSHVPDGLANLYDSDGNHICAPWGGISGRGSGQCPDFVRKDLKNGTIIWGPLVNLIFKDYQQQQKSPDFTMHKPTPNEIDMLRQYVCPHDGTGVKVLSLPSAHSYTDTSKTAYYCWNETKYWIVQTHGAFRGHISDWYGPLILKLNKEERPETSQKPDDQAHPHSITDVKEPPNQKRDNSPEQMNKLHIVDKLRAPDRKIGLAIQKKMSTSNKALDRP